MEEKYSFKRFLAGAVIALLLIPPAQIIGVAEAKLDCGPVTNKSNDLPRTAAIGTNPAGTGAHALASGLAAVASKTTPISAKAPMLGCRCWKAGRLRWVSSIFLTPVWRPRERVNTKNPILLFASSREEFSRLPPGL